jgi:hypothetical protein
MANVPIPTFGAFGIGWPIGGRLSVGAELNVLYALHTIGSDRTDRDIVITNVLITTSWFLHDSSPPDAATSGARRRGFYARAGAGVAVLESSPDAEYATPGAFRWSRTGFGLLAGAGYAWRLRESSTRALTLGLDWMGSWYGTGATKPETSSFWALSVGVISF